MYGQYESVPAIVPVTTLVLLLIAAAVGGVIMALHLREGENVLPPMPLALLHAVLAASGIVAFVVLLFLGGVNALTAVSLVLFLAVAGFGFYLFVNFRLRKNPASMSLIMTHIVLAFVALAVFFLAVFEIGGAA